MVVGYKVVIGLLKQQSVAIALVESQNFSLNLAAISQITRMELLGFPGLAHEEETAILEFMSHCCVLGIDDRIEQFAIKLRRSSACKLPDAIIVATAYTQQLTLLTLDQQLVKLLESGVAISA